MRDTRNYPRSGQRRRRFGLWDVKRTATYRLGAHTSFFPARDGSEAESSCGACDATGVSSRADVTRASHRLASDGGTPHEGGQSSTFRVRDALSGACRKRPLHQRTVGRLQPLGLSSSGARLSECIFSPCRDIYGGNTNMRQTVPE